MISPEFEYKLMLLEHCIDHDGDNEDCYLCNQCDYEGLADELEVDKELVYPKREDKK